MEKKSIPKPSELFSKYKDSLKGDNPNKGTNTIITELRKNQKESIKNIKQAKLTVKMAKERNKILNNINKTFSTMLFNQKDNASNTSYSNAKADVGAKATSGGKISSDDTGKKEGFGFGNFFGSFLGNGLGKKFGKLGKLFLKFGKIAGPIGLAITAISLFTDFFGKDTFKNAMNDVANGIGSGLELLSGGVISAEKVSNSIKNGMDAVGKVFDGMFEWASKWADKIGIKKLYKETTNYWKNTDTYKKVSNSAGKTYDDVKSGLTNWFNKNILSNSHQIGGGKIGSNVSVPKVNSHYYGSKYRGEARDIDQNLSELNRRGGSVSHATQLVAGSRSTVYSNGTMKTGGTKAWRNNNPGNITGMGDNLRYGAVDIARTKTGDKGDQAQLIFETYEDGVKAFDKLVHTSNYADGPISQKFAKYQTKGFGNKLNSLRKHGVDPSKSINELSDKEYKAFRNVWFNHEGQGAGKITNVDFSKSSIQTIKDRPEPKTEPVKEVSRPSALGKAQSGGSVRQNSRSLDSYALDDESVIEFKVKVGVE